MSNWTVSDVDLLKKKNGGGNEISRAKWFAKCKPEEESIWHLKETDHINKFKELIHAVYEEKRWFDPHAISKDEVTRKSKTKQESKPIIQEEDLSLEFDFLAFDVKPEPPTDDFLFLSEPKHSEPQNDFFFLQQGDTTPATDLFSALAAPTPETAFPSPATAFPPPVAAFPPQATAFPPATALSSQFDDPFLSLHQSHAHPTPTNQKKKYVAPIHRSRAIPQQQQQQQQQQQRVVDPNDPFATLMMPQIQPVQPKAVPRAVKQPQQQQPNSTPHFIKHLDPNDPFSGLA